MIRSRRARAFQSLLLPAALLGVACAGARPAPDRFADALPLGPAGLPQTQSTRTLAPGLTYTRIARGARSPQEAWSVEVALLPTREEAERRAGEVRAAGMEPSVTAITERSADDPMPGPLGYLVRAGRFATRAQAAAAAARLKDAGLRGARAADSAEDGASTSGPWVVYVLRVDPKTFGGRLVNALATGEELGLAFVRTAAEARATPPLAALNAGYFVMVPPDGKPGAPAGLTVLGGELLREGVAGRTSLLLVEGDLAAARVAQLRSALEAAAADGARRVVDGRNRVPGLVRNCGGVGGDLPTESPKHDFTCTDDSELVQLFRVFGPRSPEGPGLEAVLAADGQVLELRPRGGPIPEAGSVVVGTGEAADWLRAHAPAGGALSVSARLFEGEDPLVPPASRPAPQRSSPPPLARGLGVVNGGPRLLRAGAIDIPACAEGFCWPEAPSFYWHFALRRNPRTLAGIAADGALLLVAVDGRGPHSVGLTFREAAELMKALGAVDAVNLDGGGSTTLVLGTSLENRPSDPSPTGERAVGDLLVLEPR